MKHRSLPGAVGVAHRGRELRSTSAAATPNAWISRTRFRDTTDGSAWPWLVGIARNVLRASVAKRRLETSARERLGILEALDRPPADATPREEWLGDLDDALDRLPAGQREAVELERRSRRRRRLRRRVAPAAVALALVAGGVTAVAVTSMGGDDVAAGMPLGSAVFIGTEPRCEPAGTDTFDCTLAHPPTEMTMPDYTGSKFTFVDEHKRIAGGCIGADAAGLRWTCYLGQLAVDHEIMVEEMLGMYQSGPAVG